MKQYMNPIRWQNAQDRAWGVIKPALENDWNHLRNGLGGEAPTLENVNVIYDARQMNGISIILAFGQATFEELEGAFCFGYAARTELAADWDDNLEIYLAKEWRAINPARPQTWEQDRQAILFGWNFEKTRDALGLWPIKIKSETNKLVGINR